MRAAGGEPRAFRWRGRWLAVASVLDVWVDGGAWWEGEGPRAFYRVAVAGGVYELCREIGQDAAGAWFLYKVWD